MYPDMSPGLVNYVTKYGIKARCLQILSTCLCMCSWLLQISTLSCLVQRGVDVTTKDNEGLKPVDLAKQNNHEEAYELLFRVTNPKLLVGHGFH